MKGLEETMAIETPKDALDFLRQVYQNTELALHWRLKAAIEAAPYERPRLQMTAQIEGKDFASILERRIEKAKGIPTNGIKLIEAKPIEAKQVQSFQRRF